MEYTNKSISKQYVSFDMDTHKLKTLDFHTNFCYLINRTEICI